MNVNVDLLRKPTKDSDGLHPVTLAVADYDRTRPLIDGRVKAEGSRPTRRGSAIFSFVPHTKNMTLPKCRCPGTSWHVPAENR